MIAPAMLIIVNAPRLGVWWLPLLLLYLLPFTTGQLFLVRHMEKNRIHGVVGDEAFYTLYPKDLKKALKRARKEGIPPHVAMTVANGVAEVQQGITATDENPQGQNFMRDGYCDGNTEAYEFRRMYGKRPRKSAPRS